MNISEDPAASGSSAQAVKEGAGDPAIKVTYDGVIGELLQYTSLAGAKARLKAGLL